MLSFKHSTQKKFPMAFFSVFVISFLLALLVFATEHIGNANDVEQLDILTIKVTSAQKNEFCVGEVEKAL